MEEENVAVKTNPDAAKGEEVLEGVENKDSIAPENQEDVIDYEAELERLQLEKAKAEEDAENYKKGLLAAKKKLKDAKNADIEEEKPTMSDEIKSMVSNAIKEAITPLTQSFVKPTVDKVLESFSNDPFKRELIKFHYENSIIKSGTSEEAIREDLENALMIADKKVLKKNLKELSISVQNRANMSGQGTGSSSKPDVKKETMTQEQIDSLKKRGFTPEMIEKFKENLQKSKNR